MKISVLICNLSSHCLVRSYPILKVLQRQHEIEVIGPQFGPGIYAPYAREFQYKAFSCSGPGAVWPVIKQLSKAVTGDVIYAFKPLPSSLYPGVLRRLKSRLPLVLDIEDWELAWSTGYNGHWGRSLYGSLLRWRSSLRDPNSFLHAAGCETLSRIASRKTVVSRWLQRRFGGVRLVHGVDPLVFDPARYDGKALRSELGLTGKKVILFAGTPVAHKGLGDVVEALNLLKTDAVRLLIVGGGKASDHVRHLLETGGRQVVWLPPQPHSLMPDFLALADFVVLPQRRVAVAEAQVPGKVFEAMAMARPILATRVSDLPEILEGAGSIVDPEQPRQIADALSRWLDHPDEAEAAGHRARARCLSHYSFDAMEPILQGVFKDLA
jgi:glycosyltransferase involved in cell wall biosynthesis